MIPVPKPPPIPIVTPPFIPIATAREESLLTSCQVEVVYQGRWERDEVVAQYED